MSLANSFIGKTTKSLDPHIANAKIVELVEVSSGTDIQRKLDTIKRSLSRTSSADYLIIAIKQ